MPYNTGGSGDPLDGMVLTPYTLPGQAYSEYNLGVSCALRPAPSCPRRLATATMFPFLWANVRRSYSIRCADMNSTLHALILTLCFPGEYTSWATGSASTTRSTGSSLPVVTLQILSAVWRGAHDPIQQMFCRSERSCGSRHTEETMRRVSSFGARARTDHLIWLLLCSGCAEPNDLVSDTAEMADPQLDCTAANSCPNRPPSQGNTDPIHNLMVRLTVIFACGRHVACRWP